MHTTRAYLMMAISVLAGLLAVLFGARWMASQTAMATTPVVVAARDLEPGSVLDASMLHAATWPAGSAPAGATHNPDELEARVLRTSLARGEPVLEAKLAPEGTQGGLSAVIGPGKRALTVKVNEVIGVAGFALPGTYVDVMVNLRDGGEAPVSKIVLERILVLAIAQEAARDETRPKVVSAVTLEVTPEQAERLDLARSVGSLSLVLRNQVDQAPAQTSGVRQNDLLAAAPRSEAAPRSSSARKTTPRPDAGVEVIRGLQKSQL